LELLVLANDVEGGDAAFRLGNRVRNARKNSRFDIFLELGGRLANLRARIAWPQKEKPDTQ
jgi:hypothetical protein